MKKFIKKFDEVSKTSISEVGGKGANLGEMVKVGLPIPPGFCITAAAYQYFISKIGMQPFINQLTEDDSQDQARIRNLITTISKQILEAQIPDELAEVILTAYTKLNNDESLVSVRSSATAEDLPEASFAGQQESYLNVSRNGLLEHVKKCWASLWTERAVHYRNRNAFDHRKVYLAIVVQKMIPSEVSGVAFTINPITNQDDEIVINSAWGLGEGIVSGEVTPDTFIIKKDNRLIVKQEIAAKETMIIGSPSNLGIVRECTPEHLKLASTLSENQLNDLSTLILTIEQHYGSPQDIEWAFADNSFYILQSRPVTTINVKNKIKELPEFFNFDPDIEWTNGGALKERYNEPLSVLGWSIIEPCQTAGFRWSLEQFSGRSYADQTKLFANIYGYLYMNFTAIKENLPLTALKAFLTEYNKEEFIPERTKLQDKIVSLKSLMTGRKLTSFLDKAFLEMLPEFLQEIKILKNKNLDHLSNLELVNFIYQAQNLGVQYFKYQIASLSVAENLYKVVARLLTKWVKDEDLTLCSKLVSGLPNNLTIETNNDVWELAKSLKEYPQLCQRLKTSSATAFLSHAATDKEGRFFLQKLTELLEKHGHHYSNMDIANDFWQDDPGIVLTMVKGFLTANSGVNSVKREEQKYTERKETEEFVRSRLTLGQRFIFNKLLPQVQTYMLLRDNRNYYVSMPFLQIKRAIKLLAKRLKNDGGLATEKDIFWLSITEIAEVVKNNITQGELRQLIGKRKRAKRVDIEALPSVFKGWPKIEEHTDYSAKNNILIGTAGSPGIVTGPVKIILSTDDFALLKEGDILVAATTNPAWTPLFAIAKAIITDYGGLLSHGAIVAREYGIPAVLGTKNATEILKDGQVVVVDGNKGIVGL